MLKITTSFPEWPSGDYKPVLSLRLSPEYIANQAQTYLTHGRDDLDQYVSTCFELDDIGPVVLIARGESATHTVVNIDYLVDSQRAIHRISHTLALKADDILWRSAI